MKYKIEYDEKVYKALAKIPVNTAQRIILKIETASDNPFFYFHKLTERP